MRWKLPEHGDIRIVKKFLIFPKTIKRERRWLEYVSYYESCCYNYDPYTGGTSIKWYPIEWVD